MTDSVYGDAVWQRAVDWLIQEHEDTFDDAARKALLLWLAEAPAHRRAYEDARRLWLLTGLVPTADENADSPSASSQAEDT